MNDLYKFENELVDSGINLIAGVDEVGRGPLAGPVVAACVILPPTLRIEGINDSKKLSDKKRRELAIIIKEKAVSYAVSFVSEKDIDELNIYQATKKAMLECINNMAVKPEHILIDAMPLHELDIPHTSVIKGDARSASIGAASILAKVYRDDFMQEMDKKYPGYGFKKHKGYPTKEHIEALHKLGVTPIHRKTYGPVKELLIEQLSFDFDNE